MDENIKVKKTVGAAKRRAKTLLDGQEKVARAAKTATKKAAGAFGRAWQDMSSPLGNNDFKEGMEHFMGEAAAAARGAMGGDHSVVNITKDIMTKLSENVRHNFERNMELGQEALKCKTASDFIEFQRKNFEINYKNAAKLYSDLFYDAQKLVNQNFKEATKYTGKKAREATS